MGLLNFVGSSAKRVLGNSDCLVRDKCKMCHERWWLRQMPFSRFAEHSFYGRAFFQVNSMLQRKNEEV